MTSATMTEEDVWMEAENLVAENIGNAKVRAFAREVLRLREENAKLREALQAAVSEVERHNNLLADAYGEEIARIINQSVSAKAKGTVSTKGTSRAAAALGVVPGVEP
jgi:hypothetical protein